MARRNEVLAGLILLGFARQAGIAAEAEPQFNAPAKLAIKSPAFSDGAGIPKEYTADGKNLSPPLSWSQPPSGTKSLALICDDPDAPAGTWVHWVVWGMAPQIKGLCQGVPANDCRYQQGLNSFNKIGYGGPSPPPGKRHRYYFKVFALDCQLDLKGTTKVSELAQAVKGHVLATGALMGTYQH
jgi:Raf kinase inhibitor-like YbhB/YbcL family protein